MNINTIRTIDDSKWFNVLSPIKRKTGIKSDPVIVGFDTEFVTKSSGRNVVSLQFASEDNQYFTHVNSKNSKLIKYFNSIIHNKRETIGGAKDIGAAISFALLNLGFYHKYNKWDIKDVYVICHFTQAELSNLESLDDINLVQASNGLFGKYEYEDLYKENGKRVSFKTTIHFKDLFSFFNTGLDKVGTFIGVNKVSLEGVGGKSESYWKANMDKLLDNHPKKFKQYAELDARICYEAYVKIRDFFIKNHSIDILHYDTLPQVAAQILRREYIKDSVAPTRIVRLPRKQGKTLVTGERKYYSLVIDQKIFNGDLNVRLKALECYKGARVESYYRGRIENENLIYYDVVSLYPSSAMLQPLPNKDTEWYNLSELKQTNREHFNTLLNKGEGFIEVEFKFPDKCMYPSLPVEGVRDGILYFPIDGVSFCTLAELKLAKKLGLTDYEVLSGYTFLPKASEKNHPLKAYMQDMLARKTKAKKKTIDYELFKLLMNTLIGKLAQRNEDKLGLDLVKEGYLDRSKYKKVTEKINRTRNVGSVWAPEWASLILGKARAIISEFVAKGSYFVSTDAVLLPSNTNINCKALRDLKKVGSDLEKEHDVDHGVLIKTRLYGLNPLESDPDKKHLARGGVHMNKDDFNNFLVDGFNTRSIPDLTYKATRLVKYDEWVRTGKALNKAEEYEGKINPKWDGKRKLDKEVDNPFDDCSWSKPLSSKDVYSNPDRKPVKAKVGRKVGKKLETVKKDVVKDLFSKGLKQTDIVKQTGISKGYVSKVVKEFK